MQIYYLKANIMVITNVRKFQISFVRNFKLSLLHRCFCPNTNLFELVADTKTLFNQLLLNKLFAFANSLLKHFDCL